MIRRCYSPLCIEYTYYGARGIRVCEEWLEFPLFLADMGIRPEGMTIDRLNPDGNYEPGNCRWADAHQQATENKHPRPTASGLGILTPREVQVCTLLCDGRGVRDVADSIGISHLTARSYVRSLYRKTQVHNR